MFASCVHAFVCKPLQSVFLKCNRLDTSVLIARKNFSLFCQQVNHAINFNTMPKSKKHKEKRKVKLKEVPAKNKSTDTRNTKDFSAVSSKSAKKPLSAIDLTNKARKKKVRKKLQENVPALADPSAELSNSFSKLNINPKGRKLPNEQVNRRAYSSRSERGRRGLETLEDVAQYITTGRAKNIVVMTGAGISTASGIPDFRTPGTGLYDNLKKYNVPYPTAIFDSDYFREHPKPFFELAKELYPSGKYRPNITHYFLRSLHEKGLLQRLYTQNIDGLERLAGIPSSKLVEAHGTFTTASCTKCGKKYDGASIKHKIFKGVLPRCQLTPLCYGIIKPDIVFFGEDLPPRFYYYVKDFPVCDLLIVMGTSLEVEPFASLVDSVRYQVPRLLLNREKVGPFKRRDRCNDIAITGDIINTVDRLTTLLGWKKFVTEIMENHEKAAETNNNITSSESQTDSGVSSASSVSSKDSNKAGTPPPIAAPNIKRYFHTIRSTPLPKFKSGANSKTRAAGEPQHIPPQLSYYNFLRNSKKQPSSPDSSIDSASSSTSSNPSPVSTTYTLSNTHAPTIQYAKTVEKRNRLKQKRHSMPALFRPSQEKSDSSNQSESSESDDSSDF